MLYIARWKIYSIIALLALGVLYAMPNLLPKETVTWMEANLPAAFPSKTVHLGLDLRGGSHLLLQVETKEVIEEQMQNYLHQVRRALRGNRKASESYLKDRIGYKGLSISNSVVHFTLTESAQEDLARRRIYELDRDMNISFENGMATIQMTEVKIKERQRSTMEQSIEIVRRRVDETGTAEPSIQRQGDDRILVQLPGVDDPERIKKLLGQTAKLAFRLVDEASSMNPTLRTPPGTERIPSVEEGAREWVVQKRVMVSGDMLVDAQPSFQQGEPVVSFRFDSLGGKRFGEATRRNVGRPFAIVLDDKVISAPVIREPITGGSGVISGSFSTQSAQDLALLLRAGALPAPIKVLEERTVGPGLGADSIKAGTNACLLGLVLVMISVLISYGLFGVFANIALLLNMALIFGILSLLQATLTLPGIAGIVLTIGMSVDANVLIFERIREEVRLGRNAVTALDSGYKHALSSIIDANMTTLIAAILLFIFGSGTIKGFAVTLSIGIVTSIFSAVMVSRLMIIWWFRSRKVTTLPI